MVSDATSSITINRVSKIDKTQIDDTASCYQGPELQEYQELGAHDSPLSGPTTLPSWPLWTVNSDSSAGNRWRN